MEGQRRAVGVLRRTVARELRQGELAAADLSLRRLEHEDPLAVETRGLRLEWLILSKRAQDAAALARQLLDQFPASARIQLLAGRLAYNARDLARAEEHFRESDRLYPHWRARAFLARTYSRMGRLADAEAIYLQLVGEKPHLRRDLAWVHERRDDPRRALAELERYLRDFPDDELAQGQRLRLRARLSAPDEIVAEADTLLALGEDLAPDLVPEYVKALFASGESEKARSFVHARRASFERRVATRVAWEAYHAQLHDVALDLFLDVLADHRTNPKFLAAIEAAARRSGGLERLIEAYELNAPDAKPLYGRSVRLRKELERRGRSG